MHKKNRRKGEDAALLFFKKKQEKCHIITTQITAEKNRLSHQKQNWASNFEEQFKPNLCLKYYSASLIRVKSR